LLAEKSSAPLTFLKHIAEYLYFTHMFGTLLGKKKQKQRSRQKELIKYFIFLGSNSVKYKWDASQTVF
jgi:hypothetical protein